MGDTISNNSVELNVKDGLAYIETGTALTRLHYFDGKFLRADALTLEQDYHRTLVRLSNIAGGWGVVHGFGISLGGAQLLLSPGLAITPAGSTILLTQNFAADIAKLIAASQPGPADDATLGGVCGIFGDCAGDSEPDDVAAPTSGIYEITIGPVEGLCGNEEVYGKLCEDACVTDSQRPYWREGVVLRLRPITLKLPDSSSVTLTTTHWRNRVASAYFAAEPWLTPPLLSAAGLASSVWCNPAQLYNRDEVPVGLLVREGGTTRFIDAWSARRERMDTQARGYWQGRMMMRPWNVFLAQILQFQCQLSGVFQPGKPDFDPMDDDCQRLRALLNDSLRDLEATRKLYAEGNQKILAMLGADTNRNELLQLLNNPYQHLEKLTLQLDDLKGSLLAVPKNRMLIGAGFVELPPAGYLPVVPGKLPVNDQLQRMFGEGVRLHFCVARPDYLANEVEEAQHMQRISLTRGLDNPSQKEDVEIFVPNGQIVGSQSTLDGSYWYTKVDPLLLTAVGLALGEGDENEADGARPGTNLSGNFSPNALRINRALDLAAGMRSRLVSDLPPLEGLARTSRLDQDGAAITFVCQIDPASVFDGNSDSTVGGVDPATHANLPDRVDGMRGLQALYMDLRINQDPFLKFEGDEVPLDFEIRLAVAPNPDRPNGSGETVRGDGKLEIASVGEVSYGLNQVVGKVLLRFRHTRLGGPAPDIDDRTVELELIMRRSGDRRVGEFTLLPAGGGTVPGRQQLAWGAQWSAQPGATELRQAVFGVRSTTPGAIAQPNLAANTVRPNNALNTIENTMRSTAGTLDAYRYMAGGPIQPLLELTETETPKPENPARLAALNTLAHLADVTDDEAFLVRARRRLFPDNFASDETIRVLATLDWVMFRRQRKAQCDSSCICDEPVKVDSYQTWHVKLAETADFAVFVAAFEQNDVEALKRFRFQRVDVLHYTDSSLNPNEPQTRIQSDWQKVDPGEIVLMGRVWETTPHAGLGWQNNARLKRLVDLLGGLVDAPGAGVIKAITTPPTPLRDQSFEGGMLLVTHEKPREETLLHRVFIMEFTFYSNQRGQIEGGGAGILAVLEQHAVANAYVHVNKANNEIDPDDLQAVKDLYGGLEPNNGFGLLLIAKDSPDADLAEPEYKIICETAGAATTHWEEELVFKADEPNFGNGAFAATVIYINEPIIG